MESLPPAAATPATEATADSARPFPEVLNTPSPATTSGTAGAPLPPQTGAHNLAAGKFIQVVKMFPYCTFEYAFLFTGPDLFELLFGVEEEQEQPERQPTTCMYKFNIFHN